MRHLKRGRKLGLKTGPRKAFLKILTGNLIQHGRILTTEARAKELKKTIEKAVTLGKKQNLSALRLLLRRLSRKSAYKLYHEIAPRYSTRKGGYTRIVKKVKRRKHDGSKMAIIEFV